MAVALQANGMPSRTGITSAGRAAVEPWMSVGNCCSMIGSPSKVAVRVVLARVPRRVRGVFICVRVSPPRAWLRRLRVSGLSKAVCQAITTVGIHALTCRVAGFSAAQRGCWFCFGVVVCGARGRAGLGVVVRVPRGRGCVVGCVGWAPRPQLVGAPRACGWLGVDGGEVLGSPPHPHPPSEWSDAEHVLTSFRCSGVVRRFWCVPCRLQGVSALVRVSPFFADAAAGLLALSSFGLSGAGPVGFV